MKKYSYIFLLLAAASCTRDLTDLNKDVKNPTDAPSYALFTYGQKELVGLLTTSDVNTSGYRFVVQYWQQTTYADESRYNFDERELNKHWWDGFYTDVLGNLEAARDLIPEYTADPAAQKNQAAMIDIMEAAAWHYVVTTYGNVPYSEALNIESAFPKYDDANTIYLDLIKRLTDASAALNPAAGGFGDADVLYGSNINRWKKLANTLKLKMAMTLADADPARARTFAEEAVQAGVIGNAAESAVYRYLSSPPNNNPVWADVVQSGRNDFVACRTIVDSLLAKTDPRLQQYFTPNVGGVYAGGAPGVLSDYEDFSHIGPIMAAADNPGVLVDYCETEFLLAEAAARGFAVGGTAEAHYNKAVEASFIAWGLTAASAAAHLAKPGVKFVAADWKKYIGVQKWIAFVNRGADAWLEWRRLDYPQLEVAHEAVSDIPLRVKYSVDEQNINRRNYEQGAQAIGGDEVDTKLWFDKF